MSENRPLFVKDYAQNWRATQYWGDKKYLGEQAANMVHLSTFGLRRGKSTEDFKKEERKQMEKEGIVEDDGI